MIEVAPDGRLYAFVLGRGLLTSAEDPLDFRTLGGDWGDGFLLHLAVDPDNPERLFGSTEVGVILASPDGGESWTTFAK